MTKEEREINDCLIMRIKKLKEEVKNLVRQVMGSCILAFTKNKKEKQDEQTTYEKAEKYAISQKPDDEQAQLYIIDGYLKGAEELKQAKELLEKFCSYYMYDCDATRKDCEAFEELKRRAEQFLEECK